MSKRSRKRRRRPAARASHTGEQGGEAPATRPVAADRPPSVRSRPDEAPAAPWSPFPLGELVILLGFVLLVVGWVAASGPRRTAMVGGGLALASLAGAEVALREHLAGYRSHTLVLSAIPAVVAGTGSWLLAREIAAIPDALAPVALLVTFGISFWQWRELFKRRSGGIGFRV